MHHSIHTDIQGQLYAVGFSLLRPGHGPLGLTSGFHGEHLYPPGRLTGPINYISN